jgi:hypothetical protein
MSCRCVYLEENGTSSLTAKVIMLTMQPPYVSRIIGKVFTYKASEEGDE